MILCRGILTRESGETLLRLRLPRIGRNQAVFFTAATRGRREPAYRERIAQMDGAFTTIAGAANAHEMALRSLYNTLLTQSSLYSFVDNFRLFGFMCLACVPTVWLFRKVKMVGKPAAAH